MRVRRVLAAAAVAASVVGLSACTGGGPGADVADPDLTGELTIFAAASLASAFDELAAAFEAEHDGVDVRPIVYDGSTALAAQLIEGASADVFAAADEGTMAQVVDAGLAADPALFASNTLVVAVPGGGPAGVRDLADLADENLTVVLCASEVPCGAASRRLLEAAGVTVTPASAEQSVTAVLTKVAAGEADAGLVYATDALAAPDVDSFVPEGAADIVNRYPIVALRDAPHPRAAAAFIAFVLGPRGHQMLAAHGFGAP